MLNLLRSGLRSASSRKVVVIALAMAVVSGGTALAANLNGGGSNNTIVGTTGNDNITDGNGNDTIWGLGGSDNINVGYGNDTIDAGGKCPPGTQGTITPGTNSQPYCQHGPGGTCGPDNISVAAGGGNDVVWGNCGTNSISFGRGQGDDIVYGFGGPNTINVSNGDDTIYLFDTNKKGSSVTTGTGNDVVHAQNGVVDTINCGSKATVVYADKTDKTSNCTVKYTSPARDSRVHRAHRRTSRRAHRRAHARRS